MRAKRETLLDVDDHHPALALLAGRRDSRTIPEIRPMSIDRNLEPSTLTFAALLLFFLEDFFDDPGIQHGGPPFGADVRANYSNARSSIRSACDRMVQPMGLETLFLA